MKQHVRSMVLVVILGGCGGSDEALGPIGGAQAAGPRTETPASSTPGNGTGTGSVDAGGSSNAGSTDAGNIAPPSPTTPPGPTPSPTTPPPSPTTPPSSTSQPPPPPAPSTLGPRTTPETPLPVPAGAVVLHFADCQPGAAAGCVAGNDANPGTEAAPKRDFRNVDFNHLPAGSQLRFKRGSAFLVPITRLDNENVTPQAPLVFDAYGTGAAPIFRGNGDAVLIEFGALNNLNNDGGYYFRSIKLDGLGTTGWGFWLRDNLRDVTFDHMEITGFKIAIHVQSSAPHYITNMILRGSIIRRNSDMGFLGKMNDGTFDGNLFEGNNFSGSGFSHAIYLSGGTNNVIRNSHFLRNSVVNGVCTGGNVTIHGQNTGLVIENNTIEHDAAQGGCYGFSITPGYTSQEWFRQTVVRGNTLVNVGYCGVCAGAAPGILVENNVSINTMPGTYHAAVNVPTSVSANNGGDDIDSGAIVRNNVLCQASPHASSTAANVSGAGAQVTNNVLRSGADATTGPCVR